MQRHLSPALFDVVHECQQENLGTGKGGLRISLFEKWTRRRQGLVFPEADLQWVLMEFSRAASHARGYWQQYDSRVQSYILQHGDDVTVARIKSWTSTVSSGSGATHLRQQRSLRWQSSQPLATCEVPADSEVDEKEQPIVEPSHDWKQGERIGEAKNPGPFFDAGIRLEDVCGMRGREGTWSAAGRRVGPREGTWSAAGRRVGPRERTWSAAGRRVGPREGAWFAAGRRVGGRGVYKHDDCVGHVFSA